MQAGHFLILEQIRKGYEVGGQQIHALDGISLTVDKGEFLSIVGASGSGKSTLMNVMGCLDRPDSGQYWIGGVPVWERSDSELSVLRNRTIGFIFQSFNLIPCLDALENVELQLAYGGMGAKQRKELAQDALYQVGLERRMHHRPGQMSGGQQQRVAIARAIAAKPPLILADEPTGNLDTKAASEVMSILERLNRQGRTLVLITHDPGIAQRASRSVCISDGRLLDRFPKSQISSGTAQK